MAIEILTNFLYATVQDQGRTGYARFGYRTCGACDLYSMKLANLLAGNTDSFSEAAVLEIMLLGGEMRFTEDTQIALAGADMHPQLDGKDIGMYQSVMARKGQILKLNAIPGSGLRTYLAVRGGIQTPPVLGSRSTDADCGIGGFEGRCIKSGDLLPTRSYDFSYGEPMQSLSVKNGDILYPDCKMVSFGDHLAFVLRIVPGPQDDYFTEKGKEDFWRGVYAISPDSNRMACRLLGDAVEMKNGSDILSDAISFGSVQISSDGMPIVMMADHQTCGGYAKIGTVIRSDLSILAQRKPGEYVTFRFVSPEEAAKIYRLEQTKLLKIAEKMRTK